MECVIRCCGNAATRWDIPDQQRDNDLCRFLANAENTASGDQQRRVLAELALLAREEALFWSVKAALVCMFDDVDVRRGDVTKITDRFMLTCQTLVPIITQSRSSLQSLIQSFGADVNYIVHFYELYAEAVTEEWLPESASLALQRIFSAHFADLREYHESDGADFVSDTDEANSYVVPEQHTRELRHLTSQLHAIGLSAFCMDAAWKFLSQHIRQHVQQRCHGRYESAALPALTSWLHLHVVPFVTAVLGNESFGKGKDHETRAEVDSWLLRVEYQLLWEVALARMTEMFDIIVEYPDSRPVLEDLKVCLHRTDQKRELIESIRSQCTQRLLHAGAQTSDILAQYLNASRALREADPSGVLAERVCEPIQAYLRGRSDTIRCIVSALTEEGEFVDEPENRDVHEAPDEDQSGTDEDDHYPEWQPEPADAPPRRSQSLWAPAYRAPHALSQLFHIYGSRELFAEEYRKLLAPKLLSGDASRGGERAAAAIEREVRNIEMLKARFGNDALHTCSVMLKDMSDTRRLMAAASAALRDVPQNVHFTIQSKYYWPAPPEAGRKEMVCLFELPCASVAREYERVKAPRKLRWHPELGVAKITVTLDSGSTFTASVSPIQAALLSLFAEEGAAGRMRCNELAEKLGCSQDDVRKHSAVWTARGVMREVVDESGDVSLEVLEDGSDEHREDDEFGDTAIAAEDNITATEAAAAEAARKETEVFTGFITGMLTNFERMPLDRIHNMLKMFCKNPGYDKSIEELQSLMDSLVVQDKLVTVGREYALRK